jgi:hypothetical protein
VDGYVWMLIAEAIFHAYMDVCRTGNCSWVHLGSYRQGQHQLWSRVSLFPIEGESLRQFGIPASRVRWHSISVGHRSAWCTFQFSVYPTLSQCCILCVNPCNGVWQLHL